MSDIQKSGGSEDSSPQEDKPLGFENLVFNYPELVEVNEIARLNLDNVNELMEKAMKAKTQI